MSGEIRVIPVRGLPEVSPGDDLARMIAETANLADGDVLVVTQKVVSKAEDRMMDVDPEVGHKPIVEAESVRVLRRRGDLVIAETSHGFICANAGVDLSNVPDGRVALLPVDPDRSARRIRDALLHRLGLDIAIIVSDTFGRPWRRGVTDVAIGCAGLRPIVDLRGANDALGRELQVTEVAVVRGVDPSWFGEGNVVDDVVRSPAEDLFR